MGMRDRAKATARDVDNKLAHTELKLLAETAINTDELSPSITSHAHYDELMNIINNATDSNHKVALLETKINELGESGWQLASKILSAIK
tara:strand:+ start:5766 stop:6035 length:270 start_codon:yes stop_codon:yes gene_type:complete